MSIWTYITKTPKYIIRADWDEYKYLGKCVNMARRQCDIARAGLNQGNNGCVYVRFYDVPDFGRDTDGGRRAERETCDNFQYTAPCRNKDCPYYEKNVEYFSAMHLHRALVKQRKIFWVQKFANCR